MCQIYKGEILMDLKKFIFTVILLVNFSILLSSCKIIDLTKENVILKSELTNKVEIIAGEKHPLAVILGTNSNNISSVPIGFFVNESDYIDDLLTNDYVYILKCKLYNERP